VDKLEVQIRRRTVKGWAFKNLPPRDEAAVKWFLTGGPVPAGYRQRYEQERQFCGYDGPEPVVVCQHCGAFPVDDDGKCLHCAYRHLPPAEEAAR
jgi:hypothetical protein